SFAHTVERILSKKRIPPVTVESIIGSQGVDFVKPIKSCEPLLSHIHVFEILLSFGFYQIYGILDLKYKIGIIVGQQAVVSNVHHSGEGVVVLVYLHETLDF